MKCNFLNGSDCPDWLLAEIAQISNMTIIKYKLLCGLAMNSLLNCSPNQYDLSKYVTDALDEKSIGRILVCTSFIMENSLMTNTKSDHLCYELEQLGMTHEHSRTISKVIQSMSQVNMLSGISKGPAITQVTKVSDNNFTITDGNSKNVMIGMSGRSINLLLQDMDRVYGILHD